MTRSARWPVAAVFCLQIGLLTIGIARDYRLKHEDNNALHATFARSHLQLGLRATGGQNYFYTPATANGAFYANHPPGPGLVLAAVFAVTGRDGPLTTRATAIAFHVLSMWLFYGLARRVLKTPAEVVFALLLFAVLPESAFFGRMVNHEVMVLPAALLLVRGYWEFVHGGWTIARASLAMTAGAAFAALCGWLGFFAIAACALHAGCEAWIRRNARARAPLVMLSVAGAILFAAVMFQLSWVLGHDGGHLRELLQSRMRGAGDHGVLTWLGRIFELHWRYFGVTSAAGLGWLAYRGARRLGSADTDPAIDVGGIFLSAGVGYVGAFNLSASAHDYWQFILLPASVLGIVLVFRSLRAGIARAPKLTRAVMVLAIVDITVATAVTLVQRHRKSEGYCVRVVGELRRNYL